MGEAMQSVYEFDFVFDSQKVFRALLSAMANPGQMKSIEAQAAHFPGDYGTLLALGCTLLDNEEKMYVEKNPKLAAELHNLTLCHDAMLDEADYVFLSSEMNYGSMEQILQNVKHGTYADPQTSATILLRCVSLVGDAPMTLRGPGVDGALEVAVSSYVKKVIALRQSLEIEYPLGVDLIFCDDAGTLLGVPRLVTVDVEEGAE